MAVFISPSAYRCDCGHRLDFSERTVWGMEWESRERRKPQLVGDSPDDHAVEFCDGAAVALICPERGRCPITEKII